MDPAKSWLTYSYRSTAGDPSNAGQKAVDGFVTDDPARAITVLGARDLPVV